MPDALEVIDSVLSQHLAITENVKTTGQRMNDMDASFSVQVAAYKTAQSSFPVDHLLESRDQLVQTIDILAEGLKKHFTYEEKVLPLVFGELLMKEILHDHGGIIERISGARALLSGLDKLSREELLAKRIDLINSVNDLRDTVISHAQHEEEVLKSTRKVFEKEQARTAR